MKFKIIFSSPKVNPASYDLLSETFSSLDKFFEVIRWPVECELICNEDFKDKILRPTLDLGSQVADTSELFLRSYQLLSLFPDGEKRPAPAPRSTQDSIHQAPVTAFPPNQTNGHERPISLVPSPAGAFKQAFLERGVATINIRYLDGRVENKEWLKNRFSIESNVMGNLRSRTEFRKDAWERKNIQEVVVTVHGYEQ